MSTRSRTTSRTTQFSSIATRLNEEWEEIRGLPATWITPSPELDAVLTSVRFNPDQVLRGLIAACQSGYHLAGRTVVQAVLPKLILLNTSPPYPALDHLVSALWIRIAHYSLERRPQSVVANLVLDTRKDVLAEHARPEWLVTNLETVGERLTRPSPTIDIVLNTARDLRLASAESLGIVEKVYGEGLPAGRVAEVYDISPGAVRRRCADTVHRLRAHRDLLLEMAA
ncbi:MAG: hypothetical protein LBI33_08600 [Propionibacteriaceae bacterium]|nr:hypothetical protein [Propionibacteriaceae bacterium]